MIFAARTHLLNYDDRQYSQMLAVIQGVRLNTHALNQALSSLEFLFRQLQEPEPKWAEEFQRGWWALEEINSEYLSEGRPVLTREDKDLVIDALRRIEYLVRKKLAGNDVE